MKKEKLFCFVLALASFILAGCASPAPEPFPRTAENNCMANVFDKIKVVRANTKEQFNTSKESQCLWAAERRDFWSRVTEKRSPQTVQNAAGQVVIQQSINIQNTTAQSAKDDYYRDCLKDPKVQDYVAPPAYVQLEGMTYGFNSITTESCPAPFAVLMQNYVQGSQHVVDVMKKYPHLNTSQQNAIAKKQVPSNEMEKEIIDAGKPSISAYVRMVQFFANATGWCPGNNGLYRCDPNNIRFTN